MTAAERTLPLDLETMRVAVDRLLADIAEPPLPEELETLTLQLRGHIMVLIPEVETAAGGCEETALRAAALACIGEARRRLDVEPKATLPAGIAHAQRLARSVSSLCIHVENLGAQA
ncbi:DUF6415 family natural product biosynthesis protein [Streptomyces sp. NPDC001606]